MQKTHNAPALNYNTLKTAESRTLKYLEDPGSSVRVWPSSPFSNAIGQMLQKSSNAAM
jgi:hypothetical protein